MKRIILGVSTFMTVLSLNAQEVVTYGFESEENWMVQPDMRTYVYISTEKKTDGCASLKFECMDFNNFDVISVTMSSSASNIITLPKGKYTMKVSVYRGDVAPTGFTIKLKEGSNSKYLSTVWNITNVRKGKWTELSQDINLAESTEVKLAMLLRNVKPWSGIGILYIDKLQIIKKTDC